MKVKSQNRELNGETAQMNDGLQEYLDAHPPHHETTERWPVQGEMRVRLSLASELPPAHVSSSILAIVLHPAKKALFLNPSNPSGSIAHLLIGGRPEGVETPEETAICEAAEETGWCIKPIRLIGFRHFFHLEPRSDKTDRPYPDFIQPIFAAVTIAYDPTLILPNDQIPCDLIEFEAAERLTYPAQRPLLHAAAEVI
jgi:hypothetical protein